MVKHGDTKTLNGETYVYTEQGGKGWWSKAWKRVKKTAKKVNKGLKKTKILSKVSGAYGKYGGYVGLPGVGYAKAGSKIAKQAGYGKKKPANRWISHVKKYQASHPSKSYKQCLQEAKKTYQKGKGLNSAGRN